jgi:3-hydroxyacyl-[acyl-carrier-protein] dehydratase
MLQGSFYTIEELQAPAPGVLQARIRLNPKHPIFAGHFPGLPVVPGVCMLQIVKECLEEAQHTKLRLTRAGNIKFLTVLSPTEHEIVELSLNFESSENGILLTEASLQSGATRFVKLQQVGYATSIKPYSPPPAAV